MNEIHFIPDDDFHTHMNNMECWCQPQIFFNEDNTITVVHRAVWPEEYHEGVEKK